MLRIYQETTLYLEVSVWHYGPPLACWLRWTRRRTLPAEKRPTTPLAHMCWTSNELPETEVPATSSARGEYLSTPTVLPRRMDLIEGLARREDGNSSIADCKVRWLLFNGPNHPLLRRSPASRMVEMLENFCQSFFGYFVIFVAFCYRPNRDKDAYWHVCNQRASKPRLYILNTCRHVLTSCFCNLILQILRSSRSGVCTASGYSCCKAGLQNLPPCCDTPCFCIP